MAADGEKKPKGKTIVFLHPDLGIGGAERLMVDAAVGLQKRGHRVVVFTSHCDPTHCFDEARDGTLDVRVRGNTIVPPAILGRFFILCAILRQLHLILQIAVLTSELRDLRPDAFFVDQLSAGLPFLSRVSPPLPSSKKSPPILFYGHFPDLLLARGRAHWWKRLYRVPFDALEAWSMGFATTVAVNSRFTRGVFTKTLPQLAASTDLCVVYPCVDVYGGDAAAKSSAAPGVEEGAALDWKHSDIILSINRFEPKKNIALAIRAYAGLSKEKRKGVKLVVAGGYDNRVAENVSYHNELSELATSLGLASATTKTVVTALTLAQDPNLDVLFLLSVPSPLKTALLRSARLLVYTPAEEHFGIVPLEAMLAGVPVLACDSGGPTETVLEGVTGWLRSPAQTARWTEVMDLVLNDLSEEQRREMSAAGVQRVRENFSDVQMAERLERIIDKMGEHVDGDAASLARNRDGFASTGMALFGSFLAVVVLIGAVKVGRGLFPN